MPQPHPEFINWTAIEVIECLDFDDLMDSDGTRNRIRNELKACGDSTRITPLVWSTFTPEEQEALNEGMKRYQADK